MSYERTIIGTITSIRLTAPYPFTTNDGRVWVSKIKIGYWETDEESGEAEWEQYKAYPLKGTAFENAGKTFQEGDGVVARVVSKRKDAYRGDIVWIKYTNE